MEERYPALRYLLENPHGLYPEELSELRFILGHVARLEKVLADAEALTEGLGKVDKSALLVALST